MQGLQSSSRLHILCMKGHGDRGGAVGAMRYKESEDTGSETSLLILEKLSRQRGGRVDPRHFTGIYAHVERVVGGRFHEVKR